MSGFAHFAYQISYPQEAHLLQRQGMQSKGKMSPTASLLSVPTLQTEKHFKQPRLAGDYVARLRKHRLRAAASDADDRPLAAPQQDSDVSSSPQVSDKKQVQALHLQCCG